MPPEDKLHLGSRWHGTISLLDYLRTLRTCTPRSRGIFMQLLRIVKFEAIPALREISLEHAATCDNAILSTTFQSNALWVSDSVTQRGTN